LHPSFRHRYLRSHIPSYKQSGLALSSNRYCAMRSALSSFFPREHSFAPYTPPWSTTCIHCTWPTPCFPCVIFGTVSSVSVCVYPHSRINPLTLSSSDIVCAAVPVALLPPVGTRGRIIICWEYGALHSRANVVRFLACRSAAPGILPLYLHLHIRCSLERPWPTTLGVQSAAAPFVLPDVVGKRVLLSSLTGPIRVRTPAS
jgi:hypothetical protein